MSGPGRKSRRTSTAAKNTPPGGYRVLTRSEVFQGAVFSVFSDEVELPDGTVVRRDWTHSTGAVIIAAVDERDRIVLVHQYRQPVGRMLWELPAGILDVPGERPVEAAARELAEEADLLAVHWNLLLEMHPSPGFTDDFFRVFLARGLSRVPAADRHTRREEEAHLTVRRFGLDRAVRMVQRGEITNSGAVAGILAAARSRDESWSGLRDAKAAG